jgi:ABC-type nitrate/sulfonate/bicarbonate transport system permease component
VIIFSDVGQAFANLRAQKTRTLLTALGIVFGVGSVIGMLAIGSGAREESLRFIEQLGVRNVLIDSRPAASQEEFQQRRRSSPGLSERDARILKANIEALETMSARRSLHPGRVLPKPSRDIPELYGVQPSYSVIHSLHLAEGKFFDEGDDASSATVCVLGEGAKVNLLGYGPAVGKFVKVREDGYSRAMVGESSGGICAFNANPCFYWRNTLVTAKEALLGYLVALAVALLWGAIMARSRFLEHASTPVAVLIQVTPIVAYAPSAVLWLGRGLKPIVFITGLICLVPLLFAVTTGLRSADPAALDLMAVVDAPGWEVVRRVRLPYALPYLFSATRTCVGLALIGAVLAEWYALVDQGLGRRIQEAIDFNQSRQLWASIYAVALLGGLAIVLLNVLERRLLHWHASTRTVR